MKSDKAIPTELIALADLVGEFIQYWGFKRVHGRIWTHIYLSDTPLDAAELMRRLKISKALVSMSLSDLLAYDVVMPAGKSARGTQVYSANPAVTAVILNVLKKREQQMIGKISAAYRILKNASKSEKISSVNPDRVKELGDLIVGAEIGLVSLIGMSPLDFSIWKDYTGEQK